MKRRDAIRKIVIGTALSTTVAKVIASPVKEKSEMEKIADFYSSDEFKLARNKLKYDPSHIMYYEIPSFLIK